MEIHLRFTELEDARTLYEWRLDETTRRFARHTGTFAYDDHLAWLEESLRNPHRVLLVAIDAEGSPLGQVRFDRAEGVAEVGITVAPKFRGKGVGSRILELGCGICFGNWDVRCVDAWIKRENVASLRIFEKAGFRPHREEAGAVWLRLRR